MSLICSLNLTALGSSLSAFLAAETYDEFVKEHSKPSATNEKLKTTVLVHFEAHCRSLRRLVAKHVKRNPTSAWMLEPDANWMAALREAKTQARGG